MKQGLDAESLVWSGQWKSQVRMCCVFSLVSVGTVGWRVPTLFQVTVKVHQRVWNGPAPLFGALGRPVYRLGWKIQGIPGVCHIFIIIAWTMGSATSFPAHPQSLTPRSDSTEYHRQPQPGHWPDSGHHTPYCFINCFLYSPTTKQISKLIFTECTPCTQC